MPSAAAILFFGCFLLAGRVAASSEPLHACCPRLRIASTGRGSYYQSNRIGEYRVTGVLADRPIYKHVAKEEFIFFLTSKARGLWMVGPRPGHYNGGLAHKGDNACVQDVTPSEWKYTDGTTWQVDEHLNVSCIEPDNTDCLYATHLYELHGGDLPEELGGGGLVTNTNSSGECVLECEKREMCRYWTWTGQHEMNVEKDGHNKDEPKGKEDQKTKVEQVDDVASVRNCYLKVEKGDAVEKTGSISGSTPRACADNAEVLSTMKAGMEEEEGVDTTGIYSEEADQATTEAALHSERAAHTDLEHAHETTHAPAHDEHTENSSEGDMEKKQDGATKVSMVAKKDVEAVEDEGKGKTEVPDAEHSTHVTKFDHSGDDAIEASGDLQTKAADHHMSGEGSGEHQGDDDKSADHKVASDELKEHSDAHTSEGSADHHMSGEGSGEHQGDDDKSADHNVASDELKEHHDASEGSADHNMDGEGSGEHLAEKEGSADHNMASVELKEHNDASEGSADHHTEGEGSGEHLEEKEGSADHHADRHSAGDAADHHVTEKHHESDEKSAKHHGTGEDTTEHHVSEGESADGHHDAEEKPDAAKMENEAAKKTGGRKPKKMEVKIPPTGNSKSPALQPVTEEPEPATKIAEHTELHSAEKDSEMTHEGTTAVTEAAKSEEKPENTLADAASELATMEVTVKAEAALESVKEKAHNKDSEDDKVKSKEDATAEDKAKEDAPPNETSNEGAANEDKTKPAASKGMLKPTEKESKLKAKQTEAAEEDEAAPATEDAEEEKNKEESQVAGKEQPRVAEAAADAEPAAAAAEPAAAAAKPAAKSAGKKT